jgi:hypothetical protein
MGREPKSLTLPKTPEINFLSKLDQRTEVYKTLTANFQEIVEDLGGEEEMTFLKKRLIERAVFVIAMIGNIEVVIAENPTSKEHYGLHSALTNTLLGLSSRLGIEKQVRNVLTLKTYLAEAN